jgi:geranylgeranyl diphosphate synthase type I
MSQEEIIKKKLQENAEKVDAFIEILFKENKPLELYSASHYLISAGGKRLRPYLVTKSCEIVDGNPDDAIPFAAGLEVLHTFTLVHDDVMDNDDIRRGVPTVHTKYGVPMAIAAGDLLFAKVFETFLNHAPKHLSPLNIIKSTKKVIEATILLCEGQALDISFPKTTNVTESDYFSMVSGKTSALFKTCAEIGAIVGNGNSQQIDALGKFAWDAGIAFQLVDDLLGTTTSEKILGKPIGSDLREGKKTLIIIHALANGNSYQKKYLTKVLGNLKATHNELQKATKFLYEIGSIDYTIRKANEYTNNALKMLEIFPESEGKNDIESLVSYFVQRDY